MVLIVLKQNLFCEQWFFFLVGAILSVSKSYQGENMCGMLLSCLPAVTHPLCVSCLCAASWQSTPWEQCAVMGQSDLQEEMPGWKYVSTTYGVLCVMTVGVTLKQALFVCSWDSPLPTMVHEALFFNCTLDVYTVRGVNYWCNPKTVCSVILAYCDSFFGRNTMILAAVEFIAPEQTSVPFGMCWKVKFETRPCLQLSAFYFCSCHVLLSFILFHAYGLPLLFMWTLVPYSPGFHYWWWKWAHPSW